MALSNLPPGCTSPDGGIDHDLEAAKEKMLDELGALLLPEEYEIVIRVGLAAVKAHRDLK
jgi:hypothetical protein